MQQEPPTRNYLVPRSSSGSQQDFETPEARMGDPF
jgi:hypothetical protein